MRVFQFIREIAGKFPSLLAATTLLLLLISVIEGVAMLFLAPVVDLVVRTGLQGASPLTLRIAAWLASLGLALNLKTALMVFLAFNLLACACQILARHIILRAKYAVLRDLMVGTFKDFINARWEFFSGGRQGNLLNTFLREFQVVGDAFGAMAIVFASLLQLALYLSAPLWISWQITIVSVAVGAAFAMPFMLMGRMNYRLGKTNTETANRMGSALQESLALAKLILGFGNQQHSIRRLEIAFDAHRAATLRSQTLAVAVPYLYFPLGLTVVMSALLTAGRMGVPLSETVVLLYALLKIVPCFGQLAAQKNCLDNFFPSYEQVCDLKREASELRQFSGSRQFCGIEREIAVEGVSFSNPGRGPTLIDIWVRIPKGTMVAFIGESGAGKSTLVDVLMGFHQPQKGQVILDGVSLDEFNIASYRQRIGYVPQDGGLFNASIRENLIWAQESASEEQIRQACQQANAAEFIETFPEGYDTIVGDRGVRLSGGQAQRVALARALLRKPDLLILDEATSALDTHSERLIQRAIESVARQTTVVVVAHRLSTIVNADHIYVLAGGRVVEEGNYADLMRKGGRFQRMAGLQGLEAVNLDEVKKS